MICSIVSRAASIAAMSIFRIVIIAFIARLQGSKATEATMTSVDRLGFSLRLKTNSGIKGARINFLQEVATPQNTRAALVEMVRQAKARGRYPNRRKLAQAKPTCEYS
jgi:putative heme iron utilization protein